MIFSIYKISGINLSFEMIYLIFSDKPSFASLCGYLPVVDLNPAGQVELVMTDKTGTLTQNKMVLRSCSVSGQSYQQGCSGTHNKDLLDKIKGRTVFLKDERRTIEQFFLGLTICNTVTVNTGRNSSSLYYSCVITRRVW